MHWSSKVPKKIKRNIVKNDLHRARKISSDFNEEKEEIQKKYRNAGYPEKFTSKIIRDFENTEVESRERSEGKRKEKEDRVFVTIKVPFCDRNEKVATHFLKKLKQFTGNSLDFSIVWQTKKIKTLFKLKDPVTHKANIIYEGTSRKNPEISYIGETKLIAEARWNQHETPNHDSAPAKYLREHTDDKFDWKVLSGSTTNCMKRKIQEALFIRKFNPVLNKQVEHRKLILFRNGVT